MSNYYTPESYDPTRRLWRGIICGLTLSAAIVGLVGCLAWLAFATYSI